MIIGSDFIEIALLLSIAALLGIIGQKLRQPLIIMFLITGIIAGPAFFGIIRSHEQIELLAQIGIALLLFIVGLKLDVKLIASTGPVALATGLGQIFFTFTIGFIIAISFSMSILTAAYVAVALTFSSTIIIVKLLSDKKEIDSLHGQIAIGFLIVQDIAAIIALVALTTIGSTVETDSSTYSTVLTIAAKGIGLLLFVVVAMKFVLPKLTKYLAYSTELLTLFAITWAVFLGAGSELLGFNKEIGAFLAGISLASTQYRDSIGSRLISLRDFLLIFFFIDLGARMEWSLVGSQLVPAVVLSLFVLIGNPLIVLTIMGIMGYRRRTSFMAGLTVAQISEFSLIVAALGMSIGHIALETMGLITMVGVITILISTYMILYSNKLFNLLSKPLNLFEKKNPYRETKLDSSSVLKKFDMILIGLGTYGSEMARYLLRRGNTILGVDFDPGVLDKWRKEGVSVLYGDISDAEIFENLPLSRTSWLINTVRSRDLNLAITKLLRNKQCPVKVALTATNEDEAKELENAGAHLVFRPFIDAAEQAVDSLTYAMEVLPDNVNWPVSFLEIRVRSDAYVVGITIKDLALRTKTGTSILAVSRGGRVSYDPSPNKTIFPGDRLLIIGHPSQLKETEKIINQRKSIEEKREKESFDIREIEVAENSELVGKTLAEVQFRQKYQLTIVGIRRGDEHIVSITPQEEIKANDVLIIVGTSGALEKISEKEKL